MAFSCKGRGFCPSCGGRRMADTAAWLRDSVLVDVPVRQWVLTLPWWLRRAAAFDAGLTSALLRTFIRAVHRHLGRGARPDARFGAVTVIQRFGGALNLNPHFHTLIPDGAYQSTAQGVRFEPARAPTSADVAAVLEATVRAAARILRRRAVKSPQHPALPAFAQASARQLQLLGPKPGAPVDRVAGPQPAPSAGSALSVELEGFTLNAGVHIGADDPDGLERLCRYIARPPVAQDRLRLLPGDRVALTLRRAWRDGTAELVFDPLDFIARLAALIAAPRKNLIRYHGVFAPASPLRPAIVRPPPPDDVQALSMGHKRPGAKRGRLRRRLTWAALMMRVFGVDVLRCPACEGRMQVIAHIDEPAVVARILRHLGLPTSPPMVHPARAPPGQLDWVA